MAQTAPVNLAKAFKAYDIRATYPDPLNEEGAWRIGVGVGEFFKGRYPDTAAGALTVLVSRDHRPSAPAMCEALTKGLRGAGVSVIDLGKCDTSFMYFAIAHLDAQRGGVVGGVQTTASHNPIEYIGFKISREQAKPVGVNTGLAEIQSVAQDQAGPCPEAAVGATHEQLDLWDAYRAHVRKFLAPPNKPLKIFVDLCNGMGVDLVPRVFSGIDNLELITINDTYTDQWAHEPNPLVAENLVPTQQGVRAHGADLGVCFDGDADRCMLVDDKGQVIGCDHLTALLAHHFVAHARTDPAATTPTSIVYDLRSSKVVEQTVGDLGAKPVISKVGHVNMKAKLRETDGIFGGELSGHFYFKQNNFADSGAITLASVLAVMEQGGKDGGAISQLIDPFRKYPQSGEINFKNDDKAGTLDRLKQRYDDENTQVLELDGVTIDRFDAAGWWFNVRPSNTEPLLRLNAEAKDQTTLDKLLAQLKPDLGEEE